MAAEKVTAVVLGRVRHSDRLDIVSLYTDRYGRVAVTMPTGSGAAARRRMARTMPLALVRGEMTYHPTRHLQTLRQPEPAAVMPAIYADPVKSAVALFVCEFLGRALREAEADPHMMRFITDSVGELNDTPRPANFHIAFLAQIARPLGFSPDISGWTDAAWFDMRAGVFTDFMPLHPDRLEGPEARAVVGLSRLTYAAARRLRLSGERRREMLQGMLRYYSLHLPGIAGMHTPDVLHQLFS